MKKLKKQRQIYVTLTLMALGVDYIYMSVWKTLALPVAWWTSLLLGFLSVLTVGGLIVWLSRD